MPKIEDQRMAQGIRPQIKAGIIRQNLVKLFIYTKAFMKVPSDSFPNFFRTPFLQVWGFCYFQIFHCSSKTEIINHYYQDSPKRM